MRGATGWIAATAMVLGLAGVMSVFFGAVVPAAKRAAWATCGAVTGAKCRSLIPPADGR
jgi:hypothetical protein